MNTGFTVVRVLSFDACSDIVGIFQPRNIIHLVRSSEVRSGEEIPHDQLLIPIIRSLPTTELAPFHHRSFNVECGNRGRGSEFFTSKFKLLVSYADHIVGVYEHSRGGHA